MAQLIEYKCPCCGGAVEFNSSVQKMKCPYCDTEFEMDVLQAYNEDLQNEKDDELFWESPAGSEWQEGETSGMRVYICQSCAGEIVGDENLGATTCPYCGNNVVIKGQFEDDLKPDYVIPFKLDKKAAKEAFKNHLQGKRLLPKLFKDENHLDEIKGMYVPFWLFDADVTGNARYRGTKIRMWSDYNYTYTETSFYSIVRSGNVGFERVPVDGSTRMLDEWMESLEPYDFSEAVDFQTAYLAGYFADKYDVSADASVDRANGRIRQSVENILRSTISGGYTSVVKENSNISINNGKAKYALYPVWVLTTKWRDKTYLFAMNGQTGKFVGELPMDKGAFWKYWSMFAGIFAAIIFIISLFLS